jgi:hypothetical protein
VKIRLLRLWALIALAGIVVTPAFGHQKWANGQPVPVWVKTACCGPNDVHHLTKDQVHEESDGWHIDGYPEVIPIGTAQSSPDGDYWIFYQVYTNGDFSKVYCFFVPFQGT